jgi:hypothetical protein
MNTLTTSPFLLAIVLAALLRWPGRTILAMGVLLAMLILAAALVTAEAFFV